MTTSGSGGAAGRALLALTAVAAWAGLGVQWAATQARTGRVAETAWVLAAFFTVLTNLLVAVVATAAALGGPGRVSPRVAGGATLAIVLVGVVYHLLLRGLLELSGGDLVADWLLHTAVPVLMPLAWLAGVPRGALTRRDPPVWALYPLAYLGYALARGGATGRYAYPFINVPAAGAARVAVTCAVIAFAFVGAGYGLVWLDGRLAARSANGRAARDVSMP